VSIMVIQGGAQLRLHRMFLHYIETMRLNPPASWDEAIAVEIYHRLERMEWLEWEVRTRDLEVRNPALENERQAQLMVELPTLVESWYYLAFRTMRMIGRKCHLLDTFEITGIALTRNKLIEHDNEIYNANISITAEGGPIVKGPRWDGQTQDWPDAGMFVSAAAFGDELRMLLNPFVVTNSQRRASAQVPSPKTAEL
jgi:hypothetical protein